MLWQPMSESDKAPYDDVHHFTALQKRQFFELNRYAEVIGSSCHIMQDLGKLKKQLKTQRMKQANINKFDVDLNLTWAVQI